MAAVRIMLYVMSLKRIDETMPDRRTKRDLHALNEDGMVLCNPRDREAAHRAEMENIATRDFKSVTCRKCQDLMTKEMRRGD